MKRIDEYIKAVWQRYGLVGVVVVVLLLAALAWLFGIDVAGMFNDGVRTLVNWNS